MAKWIYDGDCMIASCCNAAYDINKFKHTDDVISLPCICPNCGARMYCNLEMIDGYVTKDELYRLISNIKMNPDMVVDDKTCSAIVEAISDMPKADIQPVDRWISVKDRLPEIGKSVLVIVSINAKVDLPLCTDLALEMRIGWLDDNGKWGLQFASADRDEILYWMPLPEPPQD